MTFIPLTVLIPVCRFHHQNLSSHLLKRTQGFDPENKEQKEQTTNLSLYVPFNHVLR
jgi:hypothetical protein